MRWNSLATRLVVVSAAFMLAATVAVAAFSYSRARAALQSSLRSHGRMLMSAMESVAADGLVQYDHAALREYVTDLARKQSVVSFAAIVSESGIVVAHSEHAKEGKAWEGPDGEEEIPKGAVERVATYGGSRVLEMIAPVTVGGKVWGTIRFGMNYGEVDRILRQLTASVGLAGLVAMILAVAGVRAFTTKITSGLTRMVEITREIAGGELRIQVPEEGFDEVRAVAQAFNTMAENLRTAITQVQETGGGAGEFSSKMLGVIQEQATNAAQQAASVSEVTATVEELSRTSHQIAENAESVKEAAARTVEKAQKGIVLVQGGVEAMAHIKDRVGDIARKTLFLGEKSHEIGKVMDIIKEIASEIHLLALNAAIESAAAGEHGRRFSVVASEVRRLADKTKESTETIRANITEIQSATNASIQATEQGTREVDKWRETIEQSAKAFEEIIEMIEKTSEASMQISLATHQQTSANEQVVQAMHQIAEMVRMTAAHMKESSTSAGELKGMVGRMRQSASVFRV